MKIKQKPLRFIVNLALALVLLMTITIRLQIHNPEPTWNPEPHTGATQLSSPSVNESSQSVTTQFEMEKLRQEQNQAQRNNSQFNAGQEITTPTKNCEISMRELPVGSNGKLRLDVSSISWSGYIALRARSQAQEQYANMDLLQGQGFSILNAFTGNPRSVFIDLATSAEFNPESLICSQYVKVDYLRN